MESPWLNPHDEHPLTPQRRSLLQQTIGRCRACAWADCCATADAVQGVPPWYELDGLLGRLEALDTWWAAHLCTWLVYRRLAELAAGWRAVGGPWSVPTPYPQCVRTPTDSAWRQLRFMVFDLPAQGGPFDERLRALQTLTLAPLVKVVTQAHPQRIMLPCRRC